MYYCAYGLPVPRYNTPRKRCIRKSRAAPFAACDQLVFFNSLAPNVWNYVDLHLRYKQRRPVVCASRRTKNLFRMYENE